MPANLLTLTLLAASTVRSRPSGPHLTALHVCWCSHWSGAGTSTVRRSPSCVALWEPGLLLLAAAEDRHDCPAQTGTAPTQAAGRHPPLPGLLHATGKGGGGGISCFSVSVCDGVTWFLHDRRERHTWACPSSWGAALTARAGGWGAWNLCTRPLTALANLTGMLALSARPSSVAPSRSATSMPVGCCHGGHLPCLEIYLSDPATGHGN